MKKFIKYTLIFLVPVFISAAFLETALRQIPNPYGFKKNYLDNNSNDLHALILGSSHAYYNLDPAYFSPKTFNAANPAQSLQYDLKILQAYIEKMPNLKTVILPIGYPTLFFDLGHTPESWRLTHYYRDFGFQISPRHFRFQYFTLSKMLKYNLEDLGVYYNKKRNTSKISELGWGKDYKNSSDRDIEKTAKVSMFWHTAPESEYFESNKNYLEQIAKICQDKGVILLLINPPVHITYLERRESEQVKKTIEFLEFVRNSYQNLIYVDFSDDDSFKNEDFYDADHLNGKGTKKLSLKLNQLVKAHGKF